MKRISLIMFCLFAFFKCVAEKTENDNTDRMKLQSVLSNKTSAVWLFTGNSITQGAKHTHGLRSYPEIFSERIRWEMGRFSDVVINTAISGNISKNIVDHFEQRISGFTPKVVVLMIGTNDAAEKNAVSIAQFQENLTLLVDKIREIQAIPVLLTPNLIIADKAPERKNLEKYVEQIRIVARQNDVILVDNWSIWQTELKNKYNDQVFRKLLNDPLHPNGQGHKEIAIALFKELSIFDEKAPTCGGEYYEGEH
ncbi:MAG: SGNH/GDSL hydrolase family protein [Mangrovibacterium sp.]